MRKKIHKEIESEKERKWAELDWYKEKRNSSSVRKRQKKIYFQIKKKI